jgi:hypothetical protein
VFKSLFRTWFRGNVFRKGLSGDSPLWTFIGLIGVLRLLKARLSGTDAPPVFASELRPGERIELMRTGKPSKAVSKDRRREEKMALAFANKLASPSRRKRRKAAKRVSGTRLAEIIGPELISAATAKRSRRAASSDRRNA